METTTQAMIESSDSRVYSLESLTGTGDRTTLLKAMNLVAANGPFTYAEVGSAMGGTLVPPLLDQRCKAVIAIDKRPPASPDERGVSFSNAGVSTELMLERLHSNLPAEVFGKLVTHDADCSELLDLPSVDFCFIDGEHTNKAAFSDFIHMIKFCAADCVMAFHDANLVSDALCNVETYLTASGVKYRGLCLPDVVYLLLVGKYADQADQLAAEATETEAFFTSSKEELWRGIAITYAAAAA